MEILRNIDTQLFFLINHLPHTPFLDEVAQTISGIGYGGIVFLLLGLLLIFREGKRDHWFFIPMIAVSALCFFLSEIFLKFGFLRDRPETLADAIVVGISPGSFSFPSTHATVAFAFAVLLSWKEPKWRAWLFVLATLIGLSRIYLGYHYPFDVLAGTILGLCIGYGVVWGTEKVRVRRKRSYAKKRKRVGIIRK